MISIKFVKKYQSIANKQEVERREFTASLFRQVEEKLYQVYCLHWNTLKKHKLKRIIYVIPYLSILDQTATKIHEIFTDESGELILEHHSNIEMPEDDEEGGSNTVF